MKGKYLIFLCVILLASCGQAEEKKESKQVEETVNEVKEPLQVTVIQKGTEEKKLKKMDAELVVDIINKAEKQEVTGSFGEPEYEIQISRDGKIETYYAWLRGEDRWGWVQYKKAMYMLNEKDTEKLLAIFPKIPEQKEDEMQVGPLTEVTKKDWQITAFHIKAGDQKMNYTVRYTISQSLYNKLAKEQEYYLQLIFPEKVQKLIGAKESEIIPAEKVKEGYKQYELKVTVPIKDASESQLKALESYYDNYDLQILNSKKEKVGAFRNIIQIVKEYGEKMNLQR
ncbi:50S ribosomal protein L5 [Bacillus cereus VDM053]|nr:50S ribosomal protein L5 [Bacillus cereus VDM053]